ncbi:COBRA-like protein 3 isoform X2 [Miscanthus floridulus]|uniref:COBRA-like protein 3 isoform X2 n=1 Tax=Miscanthus floridulus TaxID=154761 RepID=UPI00345796C3
MATGSRPAVTYCAAVLLAAALLISAPDATEAYDSLDPGGNITIKWDIMQRTPDGYVAVVTMYNYQQFRHIGSPGWQFGWTWAEKEVIWSMVGAQTTEQGDCSHFKGNIPHSCKKDPVVVDLLPGTPYNMQIANCCKSGVISTFSQDPANAASSFQLSVGLAGTTTKTVKVPKNFTLRTPGPGYTCGRAIVGKPSRFFSADGRRETQALMTWNVTCTYSQFLAQKAPSCCVSLSSSYNDTIVDCPTCSCDCQNPSGSNCVNKGSPRLRSAIGDPGKWSGQPLVECTSHMCLVKINWHVKQNSKHYWRVKITITNLNFRMNYTEWNLIVQHPNFDNITQLFGLNYKPLTPHGGDINDTAMFWGVKSYNDVLMQEGKLGTVQSELLLRKDSKTFIFEKGWAFPRGVYFNGDNCVMPAPENYPSLPMQH